MSRGATALASLAAFALTAFPAAPAVSRPGVWFRGDFETGGLQGWIWDRPRPESIVVVTQPVRKGRYAVRLNLAPGDVAADKERVELKVGDRELERTHGGQGREMWYGWSLFIPAGFAHAPGGEFQIVGQWHHRPPELLEPRQRSKVAGPPPLALRLSSRKGQSILTLVGRSSPKADTLTHGMGAVRHGAWIDLVFHVKWSTGGDGFVEAWLDGRPFTRGKRYGRTLYSPVSNYLRLGLYRGQGFRTTNHLYYDEVKIGDSYQAVAP